MRDPLTVFAPTDEAFAKLPAGTVEDLLKPENKDKLKVVLACHVMPGRVTARKGVNLSSAPALNGCSVHINAQDGKSDSGQRASGTNGHHGDEWSHSRDRFGYIASMIQTEPASAAGY